MRADGSGVKQLTNTSVAESKPTWSPNGKKIAFVASSEIWVMNADGSGRKRLTRNSFPDTQPSWSPSGNRIAFVSARTGDTNRNIYVMDANPATNDAAVNLTPNTTATLSTRATTTTPTGLRAGTRSPTSTPTRVTEVACPTSG
jgi:Tol biopolymer transport system component